MAENANTVWADGPAGTPYQPEKSRIRAWGTYLESFVTAIGANSGTIFQTRADLFADLAHAANTMAWVVDDTTAAFNGIYQKSGVSGSGSWARLSDLPYSFITAVDAGAGTPNAIVATSTIPISASALVIMNVFESNTASPVTVAFNGGSTLTIKTNTGNDVSVGGLVAGMQLLGVVTGSTFRLVSDQVSSAVVAAAEAAADAAAASESAAATSETNAGNSEDMAEKWANNPEDVVVSGGLYSAFHWAQKAAAVVTGGIAAAIHAATGKTALDDADELGIADSAASWVLKKVSITNLIASIFKTARTISNARFEAATFGLIANGFRYIFTGTPTADRTITLPNASGTMALLSDANVKAWVNFNGGGTPGIVSSINVSSITDRGVGRWTVNLTTAVADADAAIIASSNSSAGSGGTLISVDTSATKTASAIPVMALVLSSAVTGGIGDTSGICVAVIR